MNDIKAFCFTQFGPSILDKCADEFGVDRFNIWYYNTKHINIKWGYFYNVFINIFSYN